MSDVATGSKKIFSFQNKKEKNFTDKDN